MMEVLRTDEEVHIVADALSPDTMRVIINASGHFVVLRFLQHFSVAQSQFIFDALQKSCFEIATDHHGLRVLKAAVDLGATNEMLGVYKAISRLTMKLAENQCMRA
jgi:hypothetical protein